MNKYYLVNTPKLVLEWSSALDYTFSNMNTKEIDLKKIKKSVNLPKTSFSMKANLAQNEPLTLKKWKKKNLYSLIDQETKTRPPFIFHDGPPYANGDIHLGHLLNKVLKDFVVRSRLFMGQRCEYIPGWDCHGLPIEHKVMTELTESGKIQTISQLEPDQQKMAIRQACMAYAKKYIKLQSGQMQSLLTLAHYDAPYLTMQKNFEQSVLHVFADLVAEGIVYRKLKPVHWSIANQTALAEAELEYYDKEDTSVYVGFKSTNSANLSKCFGVELSSDISFMIWTTTPWTLPANLAIAIEESFTYSLVNINENYYIIASDLVEKVASLTESPPTVVGSTQGKNLINQTYTHPFCDRVGTCLHAAFVNLEDGTGIVHLAPGHGTDDYLTCLNHNIDIYCPVLGSGHYDNTVPQWLQGLSIWDANSIIINQLKTSQYLYKELTFTHSYPHDWRSKTPVIFRSTEQWFISVDMATKSSNQSLRQLALDAIDQSIQFYPNWGQNRLRGMLESRPDWCISRQRSWGLPIPAFTDGKTVLLTPKSIRAVAQVISEDGSDAWFKSSPQQLLRYYDSDQDPNYDKGFDLSSAEKMYDIFDVWFESGSSWNAVLKDRLGQFPADLYLEGSDQHRGWFHLSLLPSLGVQQQAPFKALLTHGFIVDKHGKKMSKSLGNTLNVQDILNQYGAEITRWWVSSLAYDSDIKVDLSFFDQAGDSYRKIRNTIRFLLSNLYDLTISKDLSSLYSHIQTLPSKSLDSYMISRTKTLETSVKTAYSTYNFKQAHQLIYDFCNEDLSSFYCSISKDILYCDAPDSERRRSIQYCFWAILEVLLRCLSPILPHTSDEAYQALHNDVDLHLPLAPQIDLQSDEDQSAWTTLLDTRQHVQKLLEDYKSKGIENSLDAKLALPDSLDSFSTFSVSLADFFGVSRVQFHKNSDIIIENISDQPRCERSWKRDETVKDRGNGIFLSDRDAAVLESH